MKSHILAITAAVMLVFAASSAFASSCPLQMKSIDAALATNPALSAEQMNKVKKLRGEGEALHKSGKHAESVAALMEAKKMLGIK